MYNKLFIRVRPYFSGVNLIVLRYQLKKTYNWLKKLKPFNATQTKNY